MTEEEKEEQKKKEEEDQKKRRADLISSAFDELLTPQEEEEKKKAEETPVETTLQTDISQSLQNESTIPQQPEIVQNTEVHISPESQNKEGAEATPPIEQNSLFDESHIPTTGPQDSFFSDPWQSQANITTSDEKKKVQDYPKKEEEEDDFDDFQDSKVVADDPFAGAEQPGSLFEQQPSESIIQPEDSKQEHSLFEIGKPSEDVFASQTSVEQTPEQTIEQV